MSFKLKTVLGIALIEICLLAVLVISGLYYLRTSGENELMKRGHVTARLIATMTADAVVSLDLATLDALVAQTIENYGVNYVRVRGRGDVILSEGGQKEALAQLFSQDENIRSAYSDGQLDVAATIRVGGEVFGQVEIGLATTPLEEALAEARHWMLTIAGSEVILVAVFGLLLGMVLTRQLKNLQTGAQRVADGEFGYKLKVCGKDELADTAQSFNRMSEALARFALEAEAARLQAEAGQAHARTVLNDALNSMPEGVMVISPEAQVVFINDSFTERHPAVSPYQEKVTTFYEIARLSLAEKVEIDNEMVPFSLTDRLARLEAPEAYPFWRNTLADGRVMFTTQHRMSDGGMVVVEHDVTDLYEALERNRRMELELMQTHKMEALGTMAGGIAHEVNTPLQFVGNNLTFISETFDDVTEVIRCIEGSQEACFAPLREKLEEIDWDYIQEEAPQALREAKSGLDTVREIVQSVKEFAHPEGGEKSHQNIEGLIENVLTVSRNQWSLCADVNVIMEDNMEAVPCFPGKLSQVLINLVVNAAQAIEGQGRKEKGTISVSACIAGDYARITVEDDGPGIPADCRDSVYEMFFTTKERGTGTGQGLAICKQIVETTHGGTLTFASSEGEGTNFTISLPL